MNGLRPPLTAPPGFAVRQSRSDSKECCRPALLFREGEFPWQTRKPIKNISSAGTTPLARLLSAVPDSVRPCRNYVELHIILLYFPAFCDTILILINFTAENSRWNINIFAKVFSCEITSNTPYYIWICRVGIRETRRGNTRQVFGDLPGVFCCK